ncbi:MAG: S8 family serine peptidase [Anaerolineae bacterium]|nr:S8 family serine peptidase [Anaerolineae bacterium]
MPARKRLTLFNLLFVLVLIAALPAAALAQPVAQSAGPRFEVIPLTPETVFDTAVDGKAAPVTSDELVSVVVKLDFAPLAQYRGGVEGLAPTSPDVTGATALDASSPASRAYLAYADAQVSAFAARLAAAIPEARLVHRYTAVIGGASVILPASKLATLSRLPGVVRIYRDRLEQILTDTSPEFIGADVLWDALGGQENAGEGIIVGVLDTGIWPEHPSFSDPDPSGKRYTRPAHWRGTACEFGSDNPNDPPFTCNNKLLGAYRFMLTYDILGPELLPGEFVSARDDNGHGTHTASTAAGNGGVEAILLGVNQGPISGIAPRAHVVMYKVCGDAGCFTTDSAAAVQQAILDGVNVINFSISGGTNPYQDIVSLAFLDAYTAGVFVAASAGNSGPGLDTVNHREPWVATVGASTTDRTFLSTITITGTTRTGEVGASEVVSRTLVGASLTKGISTPTPIVLAADFDGLPANHAEKGMCNTPFPPGTFNGEIVVCRRGIIARVEKGYNVMVGGAGGMILYNPALQGLATDNHFLPTVHIEVDQTQLLWNFLANHTNVVGTFTDGSPAKAQGDVMAAFSSRGGPGQTLGISKPDVTAPGVQILAGHTPFPATVAGGKPGELFQVINGTSMSSPHVAGAAALLKALRPHWTPGQIKSALMTTAKTVGVTKENGVTPADAFDYGSGRIDLSVAGMAALTFDASPQEYLDKATHLWDANYPSLYVPALAGWITVQRTVRSHLSGLSVWEVSVSAPPDLVVSVPSQLWVAGGGTTTFDIKVDATRVPVGQVRMAMLTFTPNIIGLPPLHFPITIVRRNAPVTLSKSCTPTTIELGASTACEITLTNTGFDEAVVKVTDFLPKPLTLEAGSVVGANAAGNDLTYQGSLYPAEPANVRVVDGTGTTPAGYLPLSAFGVPPIGGVGDETILNFNIPAFVFGGENWTRIGVTSNGYAVVGGGTTADVLFIPQRMPNPVPPNNVLAPYWTDLNPAFGGALRAAILRDGAMRWVVFDFENVANYSDRAPNSFQLWIGLNGEEDISFTYGRVSGGDPESGLAVGAENKFGNRGQSWFYNGEGMAPEEGDELRVVSDPGQPGETHRITYRARGTSLGAWTNKVEMTSSLFAGVATAVVDGRIVQPAPRPVTVELPLVADTWVNGGSVGTNYNTFAALIARTTGLDNVLLTFDRSLLPVGANIQSATLTLRMTGESGAPGKTLTAHNVNPFNSATVTYATAPLTYNPGTPVPAVVGPVNFDVKAQVMAWDAAGAQASGSTVGQLAVSAAGLPGRVIFDSLETFAAAPAKLTVTYLP